MMSVAEVMSMAMARLLVVILKVRRRYSRTYVVGDEILLLVYQKSDSFDEKAKFHERCPC